MNNIIQGEDTITSKEKNMEFNTQKCTTVEQSKRLLELGLDADTADMSWTLAPISSEYPHASLIPYSKTMNRLTYNILPAWSLHRLINMLSDEVKMLPEVIKNIPEATKKLSMDAIITCFVPKLTKNYVFYTNWRGWKKIFNENDNIYDNIIDCIEWLIKENYFNKEYLKNEE